jgi:peptidoglycan/LPS O-acetylase OafA/YrhL
VAVLAVLAYHLWPERFPGGFLGVEAFFVLSGYLITTLLLGDRSLRAFWARRARRLLPALFVLLAVVVPVAAAVLPATRLDALRADGLAALLYASNWWQLADGQSYFDLTSGASPLAHLWSLAIEEQFYAVWPLVVAVFVRRGLGVVCLVGAAGAYGLMAAVEPSRAYLGTDTRAGGLLVGALLAVWLARRSSVPRAAGALALVAAAGWAVATVAVAESDPVLYRGGMALFGVGVACVIAASVSEHRSRLRAVLSLRPLQAVGRVSYGLYLWHWPVIVLLTAGRTGLRGPALTVARLGLMAGLTVLSYRLVEQPVRQGRLLRPAARAAVPVGAFGVAACLVASTAGGAPPPAYAVAMPTVPLTVPTTVAPAAAPAAERVLLVGDSVAYTLHEAFGTAVEARGLAFAGATVPGCGMVGEIPLGRDDAEPEWAAGCGPAVVELHDRFVREFDPDVVVWLSTWESLDRRVGDEVIRFGTPEMDRWLVAAMRDTAARLGAGGAEVVILTIPPEVDAADGDTSATWNRELVHLNALFRRVARVADFVGVVCPDGRCAPVRPDDGVHFSKDGAAQVAGPMLDEVLRAAG